MYFYKNEGKKGLDGRDFDYVLERLIQDNITHVLIQDTVSSDKKYLAIQITLQNKIVLLSPNTKNDDGILRMNVNIIPVLADSSVSLSSNSIVEDVLDLTEDNINNIIGYIKGVKSISFSFKDK